MILVTVTGLTEPAAEQLTGVADMFDQYRRHYGQPVMWSVPGLVHTWICVSSPAMWCAAVVRVAECCLTWGGGL